MMNCILPPVPALKLFELMRHSRCCARKTATLTLSLLALLVLTTSAGAADAVMHRAPWAIEIDGKMDTLWQGTPRHTIDHALINFTDDPDPASLPEADFSGIFRMLWDENYLYLLAWVLDDDLQAPGDDGLPWYHNDTFEVYIDTDLSGGNSYDGVNDFEVAYHPVTTPVSIIQGANSPADMEGFLAASSIQPNGYIIEVAFPWFTLGLNQPVVGHELGLDIHIIDDDEGGRREHKYTWHSDDDNTWRYPERMATVQLADINQQPTRDPLEEPVRATGLGVTLNEFAQLPLYQGDPPRINKLTHSGDGTSRLFAVNQYGVIYLIKDGKVSVYLDVHDHLDDFHHPSSREGQMGLIGLAFAPDFELSGVFYTTSSADKTAEPDFPSKRPITDNRGRVIDSSHHSVVVQWTADDPMADTFSGSNRELLRIEQPYKDHNIGQPGFNPNAQPGDPDYGMLYVVLADGGSNGFPVSDTDPLDNGQDLGTALGSMFRIDPMGTNASNGHYGIPADNPFAETAETAFLKEIYAYGLRNPHRMTWDTGGRGNHYIFGIGQWFIEEVHLVIPGGNYGWGEREGTFLIDESDETLLYPLPPDDPSFNYLYPVAQYDHPGVPNNIGSGQGSITDGVVYRGSNIPQLTGKLVFADFTANSQMFYTTEAELELGSQAPVYELLTFDESGRQRGLGAILVRSNSRRTDARLGVDEAGEIYVTTKQSVFIYKLGPAPDAPAFSFEPREPSIHSQGGSISVAVSVTPDDTEWNARSLSDWIQISGMRSGTGNGEIILAIDANTSDTSREGVVEIGGIAVPVFQSSAFSVTEYFPEAIELHADRWFVPWFGEFNSAAFPWIEHLEHGWQYCAGMGGDSLWLWDEGLQSWLYTTPVLYSMLYMETAGEWRYYAAGSAEPRWFYSFSQGEWLRD